MTIQDAHTHFFSRPFFEALAGLSPLPGDVGQKLQRVAEQTGLALPDDDLDAHRDRWLGEMDRAGVERMVTFASHPAEAEAVAAAAAGAGGRLLPYTLVDPTQPQAPTFVERALGSMGFRGLLMFPAMHHFDPGADSCNAIYELARAHGAPVIVHCGVLVVKLRDLLGLPRPYDLRYADPLGLVPAANRFPDVAFIVPHFGGGMLQQLLMAGMQCENIHTDTSSSNGWIKTQPGKLELADVFRSALDVFGPERILFGTDSSTFPRGYRSDILDDQRRALDAAGADGNAIEMILGGNLQRMLPAS